MRPDQTDKFLHSEGNHKKPPQRQLTEWEKIVSNHSTGQGFICKIYKQLIQLNSKKITAKLKNRQKTRIDISPKSIYIWPEGT